MSEQQTGGDFPANLCTDCRDSVLVTPVEQTYRICQTCLADQLTND